MCEASPAQPSCSRWGQSRLGPGSLEWTQPHTRCETSTNFFPFSHFLKHEMGLENKDISEEEKVVTSAWFSLGEYFLVGCGMTDRRKKKELSASITEFFFIASLLTVFH